MNHRYRLTLWCLPSERHFEVVTMRLSLNAITTKKIADFQNSVTRLLIIVFTLLLVVYIILTFWSFYGKILVDPITAQKITNFQNTVRRLTIIFLSLFFLLVMRASIWSPYGKNLADPR